MLLVVKMINKTVFLSLLFLICACDSKKEEEFNITIENPKLFEIIESFNNETLQDTISQAKIKKTVEYVSISISISETKDTIVGLYSEKLLRKESFIGKSRIENLNIYFYSDFPEGIDNFYSSKKLFKHIDLDGNMRKHTYTEYYYFSKGKFIEQ